MRGRELVEIVSWINFGRLLLSLIDHQINLQAERTRSILPAWHYTVLSNYATKVEIVAEEAGRLLTDAIWKSIFNKVGAAKEAQGTALIKDRS